MSTLYYPQLETGGLSQFPLRKQTAQRTIINRTVGSGTVKMADPEAAWTSWDLAYRGLTDTEITNLENLFVDCEGRLREFVFLDPVGNLLQWTEDISNPAWVAGLHLTGEVEDPQGGSAAWRLTNGAQGAQAVTQVVSAPGWYRYAFSISARSSSASSVGLRLGSGSQTVAVTRPLSSDWQRISVSGLLTRDGEEVSCAIEVPGGSAVDVYGPQLDPQSDASEYRRNNDASGVCRARFDQDEFERVSHGIDNNATRVRVISVREALR